MEEVGTIVRALLTLPRQTESILGVMERGELAVRAPHIEEQVHRVEKAVQRMVGGVIFAALLIGGIQLYLAGEELPAGLLFLGALIALGWVTFR